MRYYLNEQGCGEEGYGRELLALFARDQRDAADTLRQWRDHGGTHGCAHSMNKGFGGDIDAHIDYLLEVKRLFDGG